MPLTTRVLHYVLMIPEAKSAPYLLDACACRWSLFSFVLYFFNGSVHAHDIIYPRTCISDMTVHVCWYSYRQDLTSYYNNNWHLTWRNVEWIIGHYALFFRFSFSSLSFCFLFLGGGRGGTDFALTCDFIMLDLHIPPCRPKVCVFLIHYLMELTIHIYMWSVRLLFLMYLFINLNFNSLASSSVCFLSTF